jgi:hypothetical protein
MGVKDMKGLVEDIGVGEADEQFVIDAEAASVEVGGAEVEGLVDEDEFGMEDLGLVFGDLDMGAEEASIEAAGGGLEEWDVGFSREDELDGTAPAGDALEGTEEAAGWQEVGGDDLD